MNKQLRTVTVGRQQLLTMMKVVHDEMVRVSVEVEDVDLYEQYNSVLWEIFQSLELDSMCTVQLTDEHRHILQSLFYYWREQLENDKPHPFLTVDHINQLLTLVN